MLPLRPARFARIHNLALLLSLAAASFIPATASQASPAAAGDPPARTGLTQTIYPVSITPAELARANQTVSPPGPRPASVRRPATLATTATPLAHLLGSTLTAPLGPDQPLAPLDVIIGPIYSEAGSHPPDTMGAVGPTDFLFTVNGSFQGYTKDLPHMRVFSTTDSAFWAGVSVSGYATDPHVRYDRASGRWFITELDAPPSPLILVALSSGPDLATATWHRYAVPDETTHWVDYDTPGLDQNALYIGGRDFSPNFENLYVLPKAPLLAGITATVTSFFNVVPTSNEIIQGVDSFDNLPVGYAVAADLTQLPSAALSLWQIHNPATISPTLSGPYTVTIPANKGSLSQQPANHGQGVITHNNVQSSQPGIGMDDINAWLLAAVIRDGHLWTAQNVAVDANGDANSALPRDRDAVRWYDVDLAGPSLHQAGTVFDGAASGAQNYWMGTLMPSGQGRVALGLDRANSATDIQAGSVSRMAGDPLGSMRGFSLIQSSTADGYWDGSADTNRWGDYTYTSLDPCDDMTLWTAQEIVAGSVNNRDWGVLAGRLAAPPPAVPASLSVPALPPGQSSVGVVLTGTAVNGAGFYNPPASLTDPCRRAITATASGGVTVNSLTYLDATHLQLNLSTQFARAGTATLTVTNPDGQSTAAAVIPVDYELFLPLLRR